MKYTTIIISKKVKKSFEGKGEKFAHYLREALAEAVSKDNVIKGTKVEEEDLYSTTCWIPEDLITKVKHSSIDKKISMSKYIRIALKNYIEDGGYLKCSN